MLGKPAEPTESVELIDCQIYLPFEMWMEIMKHFHLKEREELLKFKHESLSLREEMCRHREYELDVYNDRLDTVIQRLKQRIRPLCGKVVEYTDILEETVENKLVVLEPKISHPLSQLRHYTNKLNRLINR